MMMDDEHEVYSPHPEECAERCRILILGVGGGGSNAVDHMAQGWSGEGPDCLVVDTDAQALGNCTAAHGLPLGQLTTKGLGAGGEVSVGKIVAEDDRPALEDCFRGIDLLFLNAALGGGTATGAAPIIAQVARDMGILVLSFVTMPFHFEGEDRIQQARLGLRDLQLHSDAVIVQENDRLLESAGEADALVASFAAADVMLGVALRAMWRLLAKPGVMNLNFSDLRRLIEGSGGTCSLGYGTGAGPRRVEQAVEDLVQSPMLDHGAVLAKSSSLLVNITGGDALSLTEVQRVMNQVKALSRTDARVAMGVAVDPALAEHLVVTVLAAEKWEVPEPGPVPDQTESEAPPAERGAGSARSGRATRKRGARRRQALQQEMAFDAANKDRFYGVERTLYEGQDLDAPTFIRRGIRLSVDR